MGFADNCCALVGGTNFGYMVQKLQRILNKLVDWGETAGLKFNEQKTVVIHFTKSRIKPKHFIKMNGKNIEYSAECTYLGLHIESKLNWNKHIEEKINKCKNS